MLSDLHNYLLIYPESDAKLFYYPVTGLGEMFLEEPIQTPSPAAQSLREDNYDMLTYVFIVGNQ